MPIVFNIYLNCRLTSSLTTSFKWYSILISINLLGEKINQVTGEFHFIVHSRFSHLNGDLVERIHELRAPQHDADYLNNLSIPSISLRGPVCLTDNTNLTPYAFSRIILKNCEFFKKKKSFDILKLNSFFFEFIFHSYSLIYYEYDEVENIILLSLYMKKWLIVNWWAETFQN